MGVCFQQQAAFSGITTPLAAGITSEDLLKEAENVPAREAKVLQFLPYLSGERTPHPDLWHELPDWADLRHGRGHMTRAVLEGISFWP